MSKELVISAASHERRVAILEEGQLVEIYIEREKEFALVGSIYKGRVTRVLPGMQSAFVDIGLDSDAFLYVGDFLENLEDYDHVVTTVEGKVQKMEQQGGEVFAPSSSSESSAQEPSLGAESPAQESTTREPASPESPIPSQPPGFESDEYSQPPIRETPPPAAPFARQERRPGGFGQSRHDQGRQGRGARCQRDPRGRGPPLQGR